MPNHFFTAGNDTIYALVERGFKSGDVIYAEGGDDTVYLSDGVMFVSGTGNDTIIGTGKSDYATYHAPKPVRINLLEGWAEDGWGGVDKLSGISTIHLDAIEGEVIGSYNDEYVFLFGGTVSLKMDEGFDQVNMYKLYSKDFAIRQNDGVISIKGKEANIQLEGVEVVTFQDFVLRPIYKSTEAMTGEYKVYEFTETDVTEGHLYANVYNPPQVVNYFPQGVLPVDIDGDGDLDVISPMNRGYRTGVDSRFNFLVFVNDNGSLEYSEELTKASPFVTGSRRSDVLFLARDKSEIVVTIAHDTSVEGETRFDIPWRYGDLTLTSLSPFKVITKELVPSTDTYESQKTGRPTAVQSHSLAVGDINSDGMDDLLVGNYGSVFALLQTATGPFEKLSSSFFGALDQWVEPTFKDAKPARMLDMAMGDLNGDGLDDLVVGWGHAQAFSRVFFNDKELGFSFQNSKALPESVYGAANALHLKTWILDVNSDSKNDILVLHSRYEPFYGGNYIQILIGDGKGNFVDETKSRLGDPEALLETFGGRLQWTDHWQIMDINNDSALDMVSRDANGLPFYYLNDGSGVFSRQNISSSTSGAIAWADFDGDGKVEILSFTGKASQSANTYSFLVSELSTISPSQASLAFDLAGNAGTVAKILGAVAGKQSLTNKEYVGVGLDLLDKGMSYSDLAALALQAVGLTTNDQIVTALWTNVVGSAPSVADKAPFIEMLENGFYRGELAKLAAETAQNAVNIDLVGLAQTGIEYLPVA